MPTEAGCRARREQLFKRLPAEVEWALVTDPSHLVYFANFSPSPFVFNSQNASAILILGRDGRTVLVADNVQEPFIEAAFVTERVMPVWYRCVEAAGHRAALVIGAALERFAACSAAPVAYEPSSCPARLIDGLRAARPGMKTFDLEPIVRAMRRAKHADEVAAIRASLAAASAGLRAAMARIRPGQSELDAYRLVQQAAGEALGGQGLLYGDFVSGRRCEKVGGVPSNRVIEAGDLVLLDFSYVVGGYRGDFCNTFVCEGSPSARQRELFDACMAAIDAGERALVPGRAARDVDAAVREVIAARGLGAHFPHHTGHGVGLGHPEPPYLVPQSDETLVVGDVVTLEPGVYVEGVGGMRYERTYLVTETGCERLSDHPLSIEAAAAG